MAERRDPQVAITKRHLMAELFNERPGEVFYGRQIEMLFEDRPSADGPAPYHWITTKALGELVDEGAIQSELMPLEAATRIRFYWSKSHRYWRRQAEAVRRLVLEYSDPTFTRALGDHGEMMFDAALPTIGFTPKGRKVRSFEGREWRESGHDLDRVFEKDGISYGVEIKNTLEYIERGELEVKVRMCAHLGLRPMFIVRSSPKSYNHQVISAGGIVLVFKNQLYPHGREEMAKRMRSRLGLPVECPRTMEAGVLQRLNKAHAHVLGLVN